MKIQQLFDVSGRSVIVTGGASGLGLGMARALADNGAHVTISDVNETALQRAAAELGPDVGSELLDVSDRGAVERVFDAVTKRQNGLDIVFANACVSGNPGFRNPVDGSENRSGTIDECPDDEWDRILAVNLIGTRNTLAAAARIMKACGRGGRIVVTSSAAANVNVPFVSTAYHASKAGLSHLCRQVAAELAPHGILVNSIAPASFFTNIGGGSMHVAAVQAVFARCTLLGRTAAIEEIEGLALFLASGASSFVTGTEITIDGGASVIGAS